MITIQELEIGALLAQRRDPPQGAVLRQWLEEQGLPAFGERIIPVDTAVARRSAALHVPDPQPVRDSLIAATALVHGLAVVTRHVADFAPPGAGAAAAVSLAALGWSIYRLARPSPGSAGRSRRRVLGGTALWTVAGAGGAAGVGVALPTSFGVRLGEIPLYAPDLGWLVTATAVSAGLVVPVRLAYAYRLARRWR